MPPSMDGNTCAAIYVEHHSRYVFAFPMARRTTSCFVTTLERLRLEMSGILHPEVPLEIHGDSDACWSVSARGSNQLPTGLIQYVLTTGTVFRRSPAETQALNPSERTTGRLYLNMAVNLRRGTLSLLGWEDMLVAGAAQLGDIPTYVSHASAAGAAGGRSGGHASRYERLFGRRPDASAWIAHPGQTVYELVHGAKNSAARDKATVAYFVKPHGGGFLVRRLADRKLMLSYHVAVLDDPSFLPARLLLSDALRRSAGPFAHLDADLYKRVRSIYCSDPGRSSLDTTLVLMDPLTSTPICFVPAVDTDGELMLVRTVHAPRTGAPPPTSTSPSGPPPTSTSPSGPPTMKSVRALDPSTSLRYTRAGKSGASGVRYDRYRHAGTVLEYHRLHPDRRKAHPDLLYDLTHGNVVAERHGVSVFHALPAQPSVEPGCDAPLTAAALHSLLLESATASHREQEARDRALAERLSAWPHGGVEALAWEAILRREDVEARAAGPIGPALAGEPGHLDTVIRECLGEGSGSTTALEGAGMGDPDWTSPLAAPVVESYYATPPRSLIFQRGARPFRMLSVEVSRLPLCSRSRRIDGLPLNLRKALLRQSLTRHIPHGARRPPERKSPCPSRASPRPNATPDGAPRARKASGTLSPRRSSASSSTSRPSATSRPTGGGRPFASTALTRSTPSPWSPRSR